MPFTFNQVSSDAVVGLIGVVVGGVISFLSVWLGIYLTNRRLYRAEKLQYKPFSDFPGEDNSSFGPESDKNITFDYHFRLTSLEENKSARNIRVKAIHGNFLKNRIEHIPKLKMYSMKVKLRNNKRAFSFRVKYEANGFAYTDYWIGCLKAHIVIMNGQPKNHYNVQLHGPFSSWGYLLKPIF